MTGVNISLLQNQALTSLSKAFLNADLAERTYAIQVAVPLLRARPSLIEQTVGPLLRNHNAIARLAGLELLEKTNVADQTLVVEVASHLADDFDDIRTKSVAATGALLSDPTLQEAAVARLKPMLKKERTPEVGIQLRRTLWKLGDHSDAEGFRDYYLQYLMQRKIDDRNHAALKGLKELGDAVKIPFDQLRKAVEHCQKATGIAEQGGIVVHYKGGSVVSSTGSMEAYLYYCELVEFHNELFPHDPASQLEMALEKQAPTMVQSFRELYDEKAIAKGLQSWWSIRNLNAIARMWWQPDRQETGLKPEWALHIVRMVKKPGAWFPFFGRWMRLNAIRLLGYAYSHPAEAVETLLPYLEYIEEIDVSDFEKKKLTYKEKLFYGAAQAIEALAPHINEEAGHKILDYAEAPETRDISRKAAMSAFGRIGKRAKPHIPRLIQYAQDTQSPLQYSALSVLNTLAGIMDDSDLRLMEPLLNLPKLDDRALTFTILTKGFVSSRGQTGHPSIDTITASLELMLEVDRTEEIGPEEKAMIIEYGFMFLHGAGPKLVQQAPEDKLNAVLDFAEQDWLPQRQAVTSPAGLEPVYHVLADHGRSHIVLEAARRALEGDEFRLSYAFPYFYALGVYGEELLPTLKKIFKKAKKYSAEKLQAAVAILALTTPKQATD